MYSINLNNTNVRVVKYNGSEYFNLYDIAKACNMNKRTVRIKIDDENVENLRYEKGSRYRSVGCNRFGVFQFVNFYKRRYRTMVCEFIKDFENYIEQQQEEDYESDESEEDTVDIEELFRGVNEDEPDFDQFEENNNVDDETNKKHQDQMELGELINVLKNRVSNILEEKDNLQQKVQALEQQNQELQEEISKLNNYSSTQQERVREELESVLQLTQ